MSKFVYVYSEITSRLFYENIHTLNHNYRIIIGSKSKSAKDFYDSLIVINSEDDELIFDSSEDDCLSGFNED